MNLYEVVKVQLEICEAGGGCQFRTNRVNPDDAQVFVEFKRKTIHHPITNFHDLRSFGAVPNPTEECALGSMLDRGIHESGR